MKIEQVIGREIYDSRGHPTLECELVLDEGLHVIASVPSGMSKGPYAAAELRDKKRLMGLGVNKAIESLEDNIAPILIGHKPSVVELDLAMIEADGTENKSHLGANAMLAASIAVCRAQAAIDGVPLYDLIAYLCNYNSVSIPFPMFNVINGGAHSDSTLPIQELMIIPVDQRTFRSAIEESITTFHAIEKLLQKKGKQVGIGDEGGFSADFKAEYEALDVLSEALEQSQGKFVIALDLAANQLYDSKTKKYQWYKKKLSRDELIARYVDLVDKYPILSIEDGIDAADWDGWSLLMNTLGDTVQIVGDDLFATNVQRVALGVEDGLANAVVIKPNQVGTVTEALQAVKFAKDNGWNVIASHRSGETNDSFIVDLAVGISADYIKAGGCCRGERLSKYNQLLRIEDTLQRSLLEE